MDTKLQWKIVTVSAFGQFPFKKEATDVRTDEKMEISALVSFDEETPFVVETDASEKALSANQIVCSYVSCTLRKKN